MAKKCYDIPSFVESIAMDIVSGKMTIEEAACELNRSNYTPYVDAERTQKILEPFIARINATKGAEK